MNHHSDKDLHISTVTHEGLVTIDEGVVSSGTFNIVMTNRSNRHININNNQTMGTLRSCEKNQICTICQIVTFEQKPRKGKIDKSKTKHQEGNSYYVPTKHPKTGKIEVNTPLKKDFILFKLIRQALNRNMYITRNPVCLMHLLTNKPDMT